MMPKLPGVSGIYERRRKKSLSEDGEDGRSRRSSGSNRKVICRTPGLVWADEPPLTGMIVKHDFPALSKGSRDRQNRVPFQLIFVVDEHKNQTCSWSPGRPPDAENACGAFDHLR